MLREKLASPPRGGSQHPFAISQSKVYIYIYISRSILLNFFSLSSFPTNRDPHLSLARSKPTEIGEKLKRDIEESKQDVQQWIKARERKREKEATPSKKKKCIIRVNVRRDTFSRFD